MTQMDFTIYNKGNYSDVANLKKLLYSMQKLYTLSNKSKFALCIYLDLCDAIHQSTITDRQRHILELYTWQYSTAEIADMLNVGQRTVQLDLNSALIAISLYLSE